MQEQTDLCLVSMRVMIPDGQDYSVAEHIKKLIESQGEIQRMTIINTPKLQIMIGCWNVRIMLEVGKSAQVALIGNEELLNWNDIVWTGFGKPIWSTGEIIIFLVNDDLHSIKIRRRRLH